MILTPYFTYLVIFNHSNLSGYLITDFCVVTNIYCCFTVPLNLFDVKAAFTLDIFWLEGFLARAAEMCYDTGWLLL